MSGRKSSHRKPFRPFRRLYLELLEERLAPSTVVWTGNGDGTNWNNPANWSPQGVPGNTADVTINVSGAVVNYSTGTLTVNSIVDYDTLEVTGGSLAISSQSTFSTTTVNNGAQLTVMAGTTWGDVTITDGTLTAGGLQQMTSLSLLSGGVANAYGHELQMNVTGNVSVDATSQIDVNGQGYAGRTTTGGAAGASGESGGSYGGLGGVLSGASNSTNPVYGDYSNPTDWGSGGSGYYTSGAGGGLVRLTAGTLTLDGAIVSDGTAPGSARFSAADPGRTWFRGWHLCVGDHTGRNRQHSSGGSQRHVRRRRRWPGSCLC